VFCCVARFFPLSRGSLSEFDRPSSYPEAAAGDLRFDGTLDFGARDGGLDGAPVVSHGSLRAMMCYWLFTQKKVCRVEVEVEVEVEWKSEVGKR